MGSFYCWSSMNSKKLISCLLEALSERGARILFIHLHKSYHQRFIEKIEMGPYVLILTSILTISKQRHSSNKCKIIIMLALFTPRKVSDFITLKRRFFLTIIAIHKGSIYHTSNFVKTLNWSRCFNLHFSQAN